MVKDFLGKEIKVGDTIVYPRRYSSHLWMRKAIVVEIFATIDYRIHPIPHLRVHNQETGKDSILDRIDRVTVVKRKRR